VTTLATVQREVAALQRQVAALSPPASPLPADPLALAAAVGLTLDPWQVAALTSTASRALWNCSRQSGKSTLVALLALFVALTEPGSLVLLLAPAERQAAELLKKVQDAYRALGHLVPAESETVLRLELQGGSRVVALPGRDATVRGFSGVRLAAVDEAARVPDELFHAVTPMLATSGGRLIALSTPYGQRGWWHAAWEEGGPLWERVKITAEQCPRIPPWFLDDERESMPAWAFRQEYECSFEATLDQVFLYEDIAAAFTPDVEPLFPQGGAA
jgi:hypothetical protein